MATVTTEITFDDKEIMDSVFDGIYRNSSSWVFRFGYGGIEETPEVSVWYMAKDGRTRREIVDAQMLAEAYVAVVKSGAYHCGQPVTLSWDCWDSCVSDLVLQQAVLGEIIYG